MANQFLTLTGIAPGSGDAGIVVTDTPATYNNGLFTVSRMWAPASLLDEMQGWIAMRVKIGFASTDDPYSGGDVCFFEWADNASNRIRATYVVSLDKWAIGRFSAGAGNDLDSAVQSFAAGDTMTLIFAWTASKMRISVNGGAFTESANSNAPTLATSTFDIGRFAISADRWMDSAALWFACGTGTLTDDDAAVLAAIPDGIPPHAYLPATAQLTGTFPEWGIGALVPPIAL